MRKIIYLFFALGTSMPAIAQSQDLKAEVHQTAFDKVLNSVAYPFTVFEKSYPFKTVPGPPGRIPPQDENLLTKVLSKEESTDYFEWAVENRGPVQASPVTDIDNIYRQALQVEWELMKAEIQKLIDEYNRNSSTPGYTFPLTDYTIKELKTISEGTVKQAIEVFNNKEVSAFGIKVHLAYFRLSLDNKPALTVQSPTFSVQDLAVIPTATGELWVKVPVFRCCPIRITWKWKRIASLTIAPKFNTGAKVTFRVKALKVVGTGEVTNLVLDYPILRELELKAIANRILAGKEFELYDASAFVASLEYINTHFRIESISIPQNSNGVTIVVNITQ